MNRNIKILHLINGEFYSGAERVQDILAQRLPDFGYKVTLACIKPGRFPKYCDCDPSMVVCFNMKSKINFSVATRIAKFIKEQRYKLIHTHTVRAAMIGRVVAALSTITTVHHIHSPTSIDTENLIRNKVNAFVETLSIKKSKQLIAVSESLRNHLIDQGEEPERIVVVPNGVPTPAPFFKRDRPTSKWTIGMVALFRPRKGLEVLLDALVTLRRLNYEFRLRAVGPFESAAYEKVIKSKVLDLGLQDKIDWIGFTNSVDDELVKFDIFVLPSLFGEGMPMVILEAMAHGIPIVSTTVEGIPEVVRQGQEGLLVPPGDAESLAIALRKILDGQVSWKKMRRKAYHRQVKNYSDFSMSKRVAMIYDQVLE